MIVNTVLIALKRPEDIPAVREKLAAMGGQIPQLHSIALYENLRETGYHLMQVGRYRSMEDFHTYLDHPVHLAASGFAGPKIHKIASFCSEETE